MKNVEPWQQFSELLPEVLDPMSHRVGGDELGFVNLGQNARLQFWRDVPQEQIVASLVIWEQFWRKVLEDVQPKAQRVMTAHV